MKNSRAAVAIIGSTQLSSQIETRFTDRALKKNSWQFRLFREIRLGDAGEIATLVASVKVSFAVGTMAWMNLLAPPE